MPKNFNPEALRDPRIVMRAIIGALLAANLAAAVFAFRPFGGGADDLRHRQADLEAQLARLRASVSLKKKLVDKVQSARKDGNDFLAKYLMDARSEASDLGSELDRMATDSGIRQLPVNFTLTQIPGSDTLQMQSITEGCEGTYAQLAKFINLIDKSPRFLMIENLQTTAPQQNGAKLNVQLKIDTFLYGGGGEMP